MMIDNIELIAGKENGYYTLREVINPGENELNYFTNRKSLDISNKSIELIFSYKSLKNVSTDIYMIRRGLLMGEDYGYRNSENNGLNEEEIKELNSKIDLLRSKKEYSRSVADIEESSETSNS